MSTFRTLLVPHDFSPHSDAALQTALELARLFGARIRLLHVFESHPAVFEPYGILPAEPHLSEIPAAARSRLQRELDRVVEAGLEGEAVVREGSAVDEIMAEITDGAVDLLVMGTRGLTGLPHTLLGSVAERTIRLAPIPVLTLKADAED